MANNTAMSDGTAQTPPPSGDPKKAEKYISQMITLLDTDKTEAKHTDLSKFDPSSLQDHYRIDLKDYSVEVSHSKQPNSGADSYVILFTNLQNLREGCGEKVILAYMHLSADQFKRFASAVSSQTDRKKKAEEEARLNQALTPIDQVLEELMNYEGKNSKEETGNTHTYSSNI